MSIKNAKIIAWLLVAIWMGLIFYFSAQPAVKSSKASTVVTEKIVRVFLKEFNSLNSKKQQSIIFSTNNIIRKVAHAGLYFVLGILVSLAILLHKKNTLYVFVSSFKISLIYAISDEFHQAFVPGRGPLIIDVVIDSFGAILGILLTIIIFKFVKRSFYNGKNIAINP
jgi:VanZ family protein